MAASSGRKRKARKPDHEVWNEIHFTVASALLSELGERLVGKAHIALAELVKNSYDADATRVVISIENDGIQVADNGHGMRFEEFEHFWMRVGTAHKQEQRLSRKLGRPMTGSKGVGRLAVQFLASELELHTVADAPSSPELVARVNWNEAVDAGELTEAVAHYNTVTASTIFPEGKRHGTLISLAELKQDWTAADLVNLAREIWWLQPPFRTNPHTGSDARHSFTVELKGPDENVIREFTTQMEAIQDIWHARLVGELVGPRSKASNEIGTVRLSLEFAGEQAITMEYRVPNCRLNSADFEIRVYHLANRQPYGIKVDKARDYLNQFGGVHVYDAGFHLPFYGQNTDWLRIETDHSHRLSRSKLLPAELQVTDGLSFLPTQTRIVGVVNVNTSAEREAVPRKENGRHKDYLQISVTRDRLVDNEAFQNLVYIARWALDFYAMQEARRQLEEAEKLRPIEPIRDKFERVEDVIQKYQDDIPKPVYVALRNNVRNAIEATESEAELTIRRIGLLGSLATAGISALAYQHEIRKQLRTVEEVVQELQVISSHNRTIHSQLTEISMRLSVWLTRARATYALFAPLMDEENRSAQERFKARVLVDQVLDQMGILIRGVNVDTSELDTLVRLPKATFAEWSAVFQNVILNAVNATIDSKIKKISIGSHQSGRSRVVLVQDTGRGVGLADSDELFRPFTRKIELSPERRALGLGGTGLGLTIVRMVAQNLGCKVVFVEPDKGYKTAFRLSWREQE